MVSAKHGICSISKTRNRVDGSDEVVLTGLAQITEIIPHDLRIEANGPYRVPKIQNTYAWPEYILACERFIAMSHCARHCRRGFWWGNFIHKSKLVL